MMVRSVSISWLLLAIAPLAIAKTVAPVRYESFQKSKALYHVVIANLGDAEISAATVHSTRLEPFTALVSQTREPIAAITGTFFDPRTGIPVGDVITEGKVVASGARGSVIAIDWEGRAKIWDSEFQQALDWSTTRYALRGAVRLIRDGDVCPNPRAQMFRDPRVVSGRARRTAAGITKNGELVLMATKNAVTLGELGWAMLSRGAVQAVSLDGGSSTALQYRGQTLISPSRRLSNLLVVRAEPKVTGYPGWMNASSWSVTR